MLIHSVQGWIFGKSELVTSAEEMKAGSTNSVLLNFLTGFKNPVPFNGHMVRGEDCARVHVLALNPAVHGSFLASTENVWEDAHHVLKERYPEAVKSGKLSLDGEQATIAINASAHETETALGIKFEPYEKMVEEVVDQYLALTAA